MSLVCVGKQQKYQYLAMSERSNKLVHVKTSCDSNLSSSNISDTSLEPDEDYEEYNSNSVGDDNFEMVVDQKTDLSEYKLQRAERIKQNTERLMSLGLI